MWLDLERTGPTKGCLTITVRGEHPANHVLAQQTLPFIPNWFSGQEGEVQVVRLSEEETV